MDVFNTSSQPPHKVRLINIRNRPLPHRPCLEHLQSQHTDRYKASRRTATICSKLMKVWYITVCIFSVHKYIYLYLQSKRACMLYIMCCCTDPDFIQRSKLTCNMQKHRCNLPSVLQKCCSPLLPVNSLIPQHFVHNNTKRMKNNFIKNSDIKGGIGLSQRSLICALSSLRNRKCATSVQTDLNLLLLRKPWNALH